MEALPLADRLKSDANEVSESVPLTWVRCRACELVYVRELVEPSVLFPPDYPYFTGVSSALTKHFRELADTVIERYELTEDSFILDIGSNDGTALKRFKEKGISVLGIDPTTWPALRALKDGIPTLREFWNYKTSGIVRAELGRPIDVILSNNVISHVADPSDYIRGLANVCDENTVVVAEFPYLKSIIENTAFDIIFHQHVSYFTLKSFGSLISTHGFHLNDAEVLNVHGGNLRVYFSKKEGGSSRLKKLQSEETYESELNTLRSFVKRIDETKADTLQLIDNLIAEGKTIMGYGAAGKATMLIEYFELDKTRISGMFDKNPVKQGRYFPAFGHFIHSPEILKDPDQRPDFLIILAWTLKDEIMKELEFFHRDGGKFIIILPELIVV